MSLSTTSGSQYLTAFFDSKSDAEAAASRIVATGVPRSDIRIVAGADTSTTTTTATNHDRGFFEALGDLFMPDEDRYSYAEGLRRGGYLLSLPTTASNRDAIIDILDDEGTINMDEREETWRSEGWHTDASAYRTTGTGASSADYATTQASSVGVESAAQTDADRDGTLEVVEENLKVGKRDVSHGRVRVRSYVVEEAVSQDINLRSERVDIQRRVVDRPVTGADMAFKEQTIELEETAEEAVVSKEARVKEEIDLRKVGTERVETVSDTVRRTEVDIEDERTGKLRGEETLTAEERVRRGL